MKLKALAAVIAATPLMVACGSSTEKAEAFKLNGAGATFLLPVQLLVPEYGTGDWKPSELSSSW